MKTEERSQIGIPLSPGKKKAWEALAKRKTGRDKAAAPLARRLMEEYMAAFMSEKELLALGMGEHNIFTGGLLREAVRRLDEKEREAQVEREYEKRGARKTSK